MGDYSFLVLNHIVESLRNKQHTPMMSRVIGMLGRLPCAVFSVKPMINTIAYTTLGQLCLMNINTMSVPAIIVDTVIVTIIAFNCAVGCPANADTIINRPRNDIDADAIKAPSPILTVVGLFI